MKKSAKPVLVTERSLDKLITFIFLRLGIPFEEACICSKILLMADKFGIESHGVQRLKTTYYDRLINKTQSPTTKITIVSESPTTGVIDGHNGMGQIISNIAMNLAIKKAKNLGLGMVVARNSNHFGIAGYYGLMAAKENMIGIIGTNARPSVAPTFGVEAMFGTNALCFSAPSYGYPFLLDCATSLSQRGKIEVYERYNKELPLGWVIGKDGKAKTNSSEVLNNLLSGDAALAPLGGIGDITAGYKGYGLGIMVEILSSALQNGNYLKKLSGFRKGKKIPLKLGHFFIAINISSFIDVNKFKKIVSNIKNDLRNSKKMPGQKRIYVAGEKEFINCHKIEKNGTILLTQSVINDLKIMTNELKIVNLLKSTLWSDSGNFR